MKKLCAGLRFTMLPGRDWAGLCFTRLPGRGLLQVQQATLVRVARHEVLFERLLRALEQLPRKHCFACNVYGNLFNTHV